MKSLRDESGQILVLTVLCMTILLGFMALAIDVGLLFRAKRNLQIAADAAATAAALDYYFDSSSGTAIASAKLVGAQAAAANGVTAATGGPTVTINAGGNGEITTPYHNAGGYFEAIVTQPNPTYFMGMFGIGSVTVGARAVAGTPGVNNGCVYVLNSNACPAMSLQGSFTVSAPNCGVVVNGTCGDALQFTGKGGTLTAGSVSVVGGDGGQTGDSTPTPVKGVAPVTNPLQAIVPPDPSTLTCNPPAGSTTKKGVTSGTLTGNVGTAGTTTCYSGEVTLSNAALAGTLVFTGDVVLDGNITTQTGGVTIDLNSGTLNENSGTTIDLEAPSSTGIVLEAPVTNTSTITFEFGNTNGKLNGIIDTPGANLFLHDSGGDKGGGLQLITDLIVGTLDDQTATLTITSYSQSNPTLTPLKRVSLVE
jgi:Flp pilus assembly protein TadG